MLPYHIVPHHAEGGVGRREYCRVISHHTEGRVGGIYCHIAQYHIPPRVERGMPSHHIISRATKAACYHIIQYHIRTEGRGGAYYAAIKANIAIRMSCTSWGDF